MISTISSIVVTVPLITPVAHHWKLWPLNWRCCSSYDALNSSTSQNYILHCCEKSQPWSNSNLGFLISKSVTLLTWLQTLPINQCIFVLNYHSAFQSGDSPISMWPAGSIASAINSYSKPCISYESSSRSSSLKVSNTWHRRPLPHCCPEQMPSRTRKQDNRRHLFFFNNFISTLSRTGHLVASQLAWSPSFELFLYSLFLSGRPELISETLPRDVVFDLYNSFSTTEP